MVSIKQKFAELKEKTLDNLPAIKERLKDKRVFLPLIAIVLLIIFSGGEKTYRYIAKKLEIPVVTGANFSLEYRKIPFDTQALEINFSSELKSESITPKTITLSPFIEGRTSLTGGNTIRYALARKLEVGQEYSLTISKDVEGMNGRSIGKDYTIIFEAISGAKVTKIIPENSLDNISKNAIVFFNIPMMPLTSLENKDKLPCPVEITPKIEGKCKWTGGNVLEFIPKDSWQGATQYKISVKATDGLLYPLKETKETTFKTPDLQFFTDETFSPKNGIFFRSNFPIDSRSVEKSFELKEGENKIPVTLKPVEGSETRFVIWPSDGNLLYGKNYNLTIPVGLSPKYGNLPTKTITVKNLKSTNFLSSTDILMNEYSDTGALIDTPSFNDKLKVPNKNLFFKMSFDDTVNLDKNLFSITNSKGKAFSFDLRYGFESDWSTGKEVKKESKKIVLLTLKENLLQNTRYSLTVLKRSNPNMPKDETIDFTTAPEFKLTSFDYKDNSLGCAYFSNDLLGQKGESGGDYYDYMYGNKDDINQKAVITTPKAIFRGITKDREAYDTKATTCPKKDGKLGYLVNFRLEPFKDYEIRFQSNMKDAYGNKLQKDYSYKVKSGGLKEEDKYIYSSYEKPFNVLPSGVPNIIDIRSINLDKADVEICQLDAAGYLEYTNRNYEQGYSPKCTKKDIKTVNLKNKFWTLSHNRFDIEKDIMGTKIDSPIYIISSALNNPKYSYDGKKFSTLIVRTNLSLTYEVGKNKQILFASSLDGKTTPSDLNIEGYIYNNYSKTVSKESKIKVAWNAPKKAFEFNAGNYQLITAKNGTYFGILNTSTDQTSNYDFKYVSGQDASEKDYLYLYTERPIYKPGDTVFFKGILRAFNFDGYKRSATKKGKLKILDENMGFLKELDITVDQNSNFSGKFELPKAMSLGRYSFEFKAEGKQESVYNDAQFFVEEYKNPVFKVNIAGNKKDAVLGDKISLKFNGEYYFGGKLTSGHYYRNILTQNYFFDAKNYSDYQFGSGYEGFECMYWGYCNYDDNSIPADEGDLKAGEDVSWDYAFPDKEKDENDKSNGEKIYSFNVTLEDPDTKKQITKAYETVLHTTDAYVGIKVPYYSKQSDGIRFNGVVLNYAAQGLADKKVKVELIRKEWKQVKKQGVDGVFYNDYSIEETKEGEFNMTSGSNGEINDDLAAKSNGEYEVRATYTGENGKSYISSANVYVAGNEVTYWNEGNNTITELTADKSILKIGDTANFTLKSPVASGKIFVAIEKDDGILDYFTQDITDTAPRISVPVKDSYYPNFYVKTFLIGKNGADPLPVYKRALSVIKIVTDYKNIKVKITPEKNHYLPGDKVKLNIKTIDEAGNIVPNANGSISMVDESVLALKGNPKKNPFAYFYDLKRYLGIETFVSLFNLVEKLEVKDIKDGEKGGAGEGMKGGNSKKKRGIFKDTAFWQADFTTDKNGIANITTEALPDNLTTWFIESVVSTSDDTKIGVGEATVVTSKKVMINENTPRFLGSNDSITLSPVIFNKTGKNSDFTVSISGNNFKVSDPSQTIRINNGEQKTVYFEIKVADLGILASGSRMADITLKAVSADTKDEDSVIRYLPIVPTSTLETVATVGKTDAVSHLEKIDLANVPLGAAKLVIRYAPSLLSNIASSIDFLASFPYGCIEQKQSAIMPNVYTKKLYDSIGLPFDLTKKMVKVFVDSDTGEKDVSEDELIKNYIAESPKFQKMSGGFSYWTDDNSPYADLHLTTLIVKGMAEIRSIGYTINEASMKSAINYLKTRFYSNSYEGCRATDCKYPETERLEVIIAILSMEPDNYEAYKMWKLLDFKDEELSTKISKLSVISRFIKNKNIPAADRGELEKLGIETGNKIIADHVVYNPRGAFLGKDSLNSRIKNTSDFIGAISDFGLERFDDISQIADNMNKWIVSEKTKGRFGSTEDTNSVIRNAAKYIAASGELKGVNMNIVLNLNNKKISTTQVDEKNKLEVFEKVLTGDKLKAQNDFTINKDGTGKVYYDLALSYYLPSNKVKARDEGFYLEQSYYDYNGYKKIETLKNEEYAKFLNGEIDHKDLRYPKNIVEYLEPVRDMKVGQLIVAYNKIATPEDRDQVSFEGFIPAGSELVNTNLDTENKSLKFENFFNRSEFRDDRFFGYANTMSPGIYEFNYVIRITHKGIFNLQPSRISEFYNIEVFGSNSGKAIDIRQ